MSRRRSRDRGVVTIFWRDIPAQVTATTDSGNEKVLLSDRFQVAIDRAAGVAGMTDADDYVEQWRREATPIDGDPIEAAKTRAEQLEAAFDRQRLQAFVRNGGTDPDPITEQPTAGADIQ